MRHGHGHEPDNPLQRYVTCMLRPNIAVPKFRCHETRGHLFRSLPASYWGSFGPPKRFLWTLVFIMLAYADKKYTVLVLRAKSLKF